MALKHLSRAPQPAAIEKEAVCERASERRRKHVSAVCRRTPAQTFAERASERGREDMRRALKQTFIELSFSPSSARTPYVIAKLSGGQRKREKARAQSSLIRLLLTLHIGGADMQSMDGVKFPMYFFEHECRETYVQRRT